MTMQVKRTWLLVLALLAVAALAACGNDDDNNDANGANGVAPGQSDDTASDDANGGSEPAPTEPPATEPPAVEVPAGWSAFTEPEYEGIVRDGWVYQTLDASMFTGDTSSILPDLPAESRETIVASLAGQGLDNVLYVYVDPNHPVLASNISLLTCGDAAGITLDPQVFLDVYEDANIEAEQVDTIAVFGEDTGVFRLLVNPGIETYQVPFRAGGACESIATFVGLPEDQDQFDDFVTFLEHLRLPN